MEPKESPHSQVNSKLKEHSERHRITEPQVYSNQNSIVLVPEEIYRPMEQNRGLGGNTVYLQSFDVSQIWQKQPMGKRFCI